MVSEVAGKRGLICVGVRWESGITPGGLQEQSDCGLAIRLAYGAIILVIQKKRTGSNYVKTKTRKEFTDLSFFALHDYLGSQVGGGEPGYVVCEPRRGSCFLTLFIALCISVL